MSVQVENAGATIVASLIVGLLVAGTLGAFFTMIGLGILHAELAAAIPALGLWKSFLVAIGIRWVMPINTSTSSSS